MILFEHRWLEMRWPHYCTLLLSSHKKPVSTALWPVWLIPGPTAIDYLFKDKLCNWGSSAARSNRELLSASRWSPEPYHLVDLKPAAPSSGNAETIKEFNGDILSAHSLKLRLLRSYYPWISLGDSERVGLHMDVLWYVSQCLFPLISYSQAVACRLAFSCCPLFFFFVCLRLSVMMIFVIPVVIAHVEKTQW